MEQWALAGFTELRHLGAGAFGRVVLARHDASGQLVAVKYLSGSGDRTQFRHEAAILRQVVSPHVTRLYEFVEEPRGAAIVMEAVPGVALKAILDREPALPPEAALAILKGSLLGLAAAHSAHIVHRDYKPGNVLVQPNHQSKLVDFGIALLSGHSGQSSGTPAYMAPEQWLGGPATPATDVYAATCVFFLCVTGMRPFSGDTDSLRGLHQHAPVPVEAVPEPLRALVANGMAKDPAARPASAAAFVAQLEAAATAGYGQDWESRGWQRLAWHAGTLLALSPLAFLASTAGVLAPAAGTAIAGGAAGTGIFAGVAAKAVAVAVGLVVVAGAAVVVVTNADDDDPPGTSQEAFRADVLVRDETFDNFSFNGQYVQVSGVADAGVQARINEALLAPVDGWVSFVDERTSDPSPGAQPAEGTVAAEIRISGPKVLSVRYLRVAGDPGGEFFGAGGEASIRSVTIDLTTGQVLQLADIFPGVTSDDGAMALAERVVAAHPEGICGDGGGEGSAPVEFTAESFSDPYSPADDPIVQVVVTPDGVDFEIYPSAFGYANACDLTASPVPYADLTDLMSPRAVELLTR